MPPILEAIRPADIDPDEVPRAVVAYGVSMVTGGFELDFHEHRKAQLMMPLRGLLTCEAGGVLWIVPPQSAIWIPGSVSGTLSVPMPTDARLRKIVKTMMAKPARRGTMESWAKSAGLSERSLARLIARQTGMSFGRWRQQLNVMLALQWLAEGVSVQRVAASLGYESAGSFVSMFRKALGVPPGKFMARGRASTR